MRKIYKEKELLVCQKDYSQIPVNCILKLATKDQGMVMKDDC